MLPILILTIYATGVASLPIIFGYQSYSDLKHTSDVSGPQKLFIAGVNQRHKRPMSLHGDAIAYNVDEKDLHNFIPADLNRPTTLEPASTTIKPDADIHHSYREVVTRSTRGHELFSLEEGKPAAVGGAIEACYGNLKLLPRKIVRKMNKRRRRLAQAIRRLNKLQRTYCLNRRSADDKQESCSEWRTEKMALYVKLMQLTHCVSKAKSLAVKV